MERGLKGLIVKAEPWQIFFVFVGAILLYGIVPNDQQVLKIIASISLGIVIFGWFLVLGTSLNENLPEDEQSSDTLFIICCFYGLLLVSVSALLKDIALDEDLISYAAVVLVSFGLSTFYIIYFASIQFTSNQERFLDKEKLNAQSIFILFICFIIGVLVLQSRVRKFFT